MSEKELDINQLERFRKGDRQAFQTIFTLLNKTVCEIAYKVTGSAAEAEDICSDAFIKLFENRERIENFQHLKGFLYTITRNLSLNYLRKTEIHHKSHRELSYLAGDPSGWEQAIEEAIIYNELIREIRIEIDNLSKVSPRYAQVLELTVFEKKKTEEIARLLGISESTVRNLKAKAIRNLQAAFLKKGLLSNAALIGLASLLSSELNLN